MHSPYALVIVRQRSDTASCGGEKRRLSLVGIRLTRTEKERVSADTMVSLLPRKDAVNAHAADPQSLGDGRRTMPRLAHLSDLGDGHRGFTAFVDAFRLGCFEPACCRSRMNRRSISATMPSTV